MSNIYIQEPPTSGKVLLRTTVGDIDVELWCKETPRACRNFLQLCMEGYYDGTPFHCVVPGFVAQGGDPLGDGTGGESVYGEPFKDEFHSRLRFVRRGLVAMANGGKDDNGSQFFFTLGATPELQNRNTIFGKVTGDTLYNMLKLEDGLVDREDRPLHPQRILSCQVLLNPFADIRPRVVERPVPAEPEKPRERGQKNFNLLSFGEEAEEDEEEMNAVNEAFRGQSKSSHDLADDPELSSVPAIAPDGGFRGEATGGAALEAVRGRLERAARDGRGAVGREAPPDRAEEDDAERKREEVRKQIKDLKRELRRKKEPEEEEEEPAPEDGPEAEQNGVLAQYRRTHEAYRSRREALPPKGTSGREALTLQLLEKFRQKLETAKEAAPPESDGGEESEDGGAWLAHRLRAEEGGREAVLAKDASLPTAERYDLSDPRNPMVQRRRHKRRREDEAV